MTIDRNRSSYRSYAVQRLALLQAQLLRCRDSLNFARYQERKQQLQHEQQHLQQLQVVEQNVDEKAADSSTKVASVTGRPPDEFTSPKAVVASLIASQLLRPATTAVGAASAECSVEVLENRERILLSKIADLEAEDSTGERHHALSSAGTVHSIFVCNQCGLDIAYGEPHRRYHCTECFDFDLCAACFENGEGGGGRDIPADSAAVGVENSSGLQSPFEDQYYLTASSISPTSSNSSSSSCSSSPSSSSSSSSCSASRGTAFYHSHPPRSGSRPEEPQAQRQWHWCVLEHFDTAECQRMIARMGNVSSVVRTAFRVFARRPCLGFCVGEEEEEVQWRWHSYDQIFARCCRFLRQLHHLYHSSFPPIGESAAAQTSSSSSIRSSWPSSIGIAGANSVEWFIVDFACLMAGIVSVPMHADLSCEHISYVAQHSAKVDILVVQPELWSKFHTSAFGTPCYSFDDFSLSAVLAGESSVLADRALVEPLLPPLFALATSAEQPASSASSPVSASLSSSSSSSAPGECLQLQQDARVATLIHTSGSTGFPKGVKITDQLWRKLCVHTGWGGRDNEDPRVRISKDSLAHVSDREDVHINFLRGGRTGMLEQVHRIFAVLLALGPTVISSTPRFWDHLHQSFLQEKRDRLSAIAEAATEKALTGAQEEETNVTAYLTDKYRRMLGRRLKVIALGGAPCAPSTKEWLRSVWGGTVSVQDGYGCTEAGQLADDDGTIYRRVQWKLRAVPEWGYDAVTRPRRGEFLVKTPETIGSYVNAADTAKGFDDEGYFCTGDVVEVTQEEGSAAEADVAKAGYQPVVTSAKIRLIDRVANYFKLAQGVFVAPAPLEQIFQACLLFDQIIILQASLQFAQTAVSAVVSCRPYAMPTTTRESTAEWKVDEVPAEKELLELPSAEMVRQALCQIAVRAGLKGFEMPRVVVVVADEWTVANNLLTASAKINRLALIKKYRPLVDAAFLEAASGDEKPRHQQQHTHYRKQGTTTTITTADCHSSAPAPNLTAIIVATPTSAITLDDIFCTVADSLTRLPSFNTAVSTSAVGSAVRVVLQAACQALRCPPDAIMSEMTLKQQGADSLAVLQFVNQYNRETKLAAAAVERSPPPARQHVATTHTTTTTVMTHTAATATAPAASLFRKKMTFPVAARLTVQQLCLFGLPQLQMRSTITAAADERRAADENRAPAEGGNQGNDQSSNNTGRAPDDGHDDDDDEEEEEEEEEEDDGTIVELMARMRADIQVGAPSLHPGPGDIAMPTTESPTIQCVLLTGAAGFVGQGMLRALLEQTSWLIVVLLHRSPLPEFAAPFASAIGAEAVAESPRVVVVHSWEELETRTIATHSLSNSSSQFALSGSCPAVLLSHAIDTIVHLAGRVNHLESYRTHRAANVLAMRRVLHFSRVSGAPFVKRVFFSSSISVMDPQSGKLLTLAQAAQAGGYVASKYVCDQMCAQFMAATAMQHEQSQSVSSPPILSSPTSSSQTMCILRLGLISWDRHGANSTDWLCRLLAGCRQLAKAPLTATGHVPLLDLLPRDVCCDFILALIRASVCGGGSGGSGDGSGMDPCSGGCATWLLINSQNKVSLADLINWVSPASLVSSHSSSSTCSPQAAAKDHKAATEREKEEKVDAIATAATSTAITTTIAMVDFRSWLTHVHQRIACCDPSTPGAVDDRGSKTGCCSVHHHDHNLDRGLLLFEESGVPDDTNDQLDNSSLWKFLRKHGIRGGAGSDNEWCGQLERRAVITPAYGALFPARL